jgi:hypothetical protein
MAQLIRIINHINNLNNDDDILDYLYTFNNINKIFNKSSEQIQIDFIKQLLNKIKSKDKFKDSLPLFKIQNIYTLNKLLEWGVKYNDYNICYFVLNHKDKNIYITTNQYCEFENNTNNKDISLLFSEFRIKEANDSECSSDSSDSSNSSNSSDSSNSRSLYSDSNCSSYSCSNSSSLYSDSSNSSNSSSDSEDEIRTRDIKIIEDID